MTAAPPPPPGPQLRRTRDRGMSGRGVAGRPTQAVRLTALLFTLLASGLISVLHTGCSTPGPPPEPAASSGPAHDLPQPASRDAPRKALERFATEQRAAATQAMQQQRYHDASLAWAAVLAIKPTDAAALSGLSRSRHAAEQAAADARRRASQARARGEIDSAMRGYLEVLAHDPSDDEAMQALHVLGRERMHGVMAPSTPAAARTPTPRGGPVIELEHADLLEAEGEFESALVLLEPLARKPNAEPALKQRVCRLLLIQAAARTRAGDPPQAAALTQRCLSLLPHPRQAAPRTGATKAR